MLPFGTMRRLYDRGPGCRGLAVDAEGVMLGPDCVLVHRLPGGRYRPAGPDAVALLARALFDDDAGLRRLPIVLSGIVAALDRGDLVKAQLLGLEIPIDRLDEPRLQRLGRASDLLKDGFDPNQLRDERGRWAREGGAAARMKPATLPKPSLLGRVASAVLRALAQLGARFAAPAAFLSTIFIPTNRSLISQGTVPDRPDLSFEYDEGAGRLRLYRQDNDGGRSLVFQGRPDAGGIIRDDDGHAIGRKVDGSVVILDPDTLPDAKSGSPDRQDERPKLCPDTTEESTEGRKERALKYQAFITGLPPGLDVKLRDPETGKDVSFDGCRESDGTMLEAKGPGYLERLEEQHPVVWASMEAELDEQAKRQSRSALASGHRVEWHFAEAEVADHFRERWQGRFPNLTLIHTPPPDEP